MATPRPYVYEEAQKISSGSYGGVYEGRLAKTGEPVVVKVARGSTAQQSLCNEFALLQDIAKGFANGHPNIVRAYANIDCPREVSFAMEMADCSVQDLLLQPRYCHGMPPEMYLDFLRDTTSGIMRIRELSIVHRDIKVANVLVFPIASSKCKSKYSFKLCDFGCSREARDSSMMHTLQGTKGYLNPVFANHVAECTKNRRGLDFVVDEYTAEIIDLWSLGVTHYQCATGNYPFPLDDIEYAEVLKSRPPGTIAGKRGRGNFVFAKKIRNTEFPSWLIDCTSRLIAMTFDNPSFVTLAEMTEELFNVPVLKVAALDAFKITEHADLSTTTHFRDLDLPLNTVLNLSGDTDYNWVGEKKRYHSATGEDVKCSTLPFSECIVFPGTARVVTLQKKSNSYFNNTDVPNYEPVQAFERRREHLLLCWRALKDCDDMIQFVEMIKRILLEQVQALRAECSEYTRQAELGELSSTFLKSFGQSLILLRKKDAVPCPKQAERAKDESTRTLVTIQKILQRVDELNKVKNLYLEEHPLPRAPAQLDELGNLAETSRRNNLDRFGLVNETWMRTLGDTCVDRRKLLSDQIADMYRKDNGLLYLIRLAVECGTKLDEVKQNISLTSGLVSEGFKNCQYLLNQIRAENDLSDSMLKRLERSLEAGNAGEALFRTHGSEKEYRELRNMIKEISAAFTQMKTKQQEENRKREELRAALVGNTRAAEQNTGSEQEN